MTVGAERNQRDTAGPPHPPVQSVSSLYSPVGLHWRSLTGRTWSPSPRSYPRMMRKRWSLTRRSLRGQRRKNLVSIHKSLSSNKRFFELLNLYWRNNKISNLNVRKMTIFYNFTEHFSKVFNFGKYLMTFWLISGQFFCISRAVVVVGSFMVSSFSEALDPWMRLKDWSMDLTSASVSSVALEKRVDWDWGTRIIELKHRS